MCIESTVLVLVGTDVDNMKHTTSGHIHIATTLNANKTRTVERLMFSFAVATTTASPITMAIMKAHATATIALYVDDVRLRHEPCAFNKSNRWLCVESVYWAGVVLQVYILTLPCYCSWSRCFIPLHK